ncbi:MAG: MBL fold metallo-hydrolase [Verrucomicrobiota bacterium]|nr:MBL fold metallo-hydrolase [Verrucomicrobiota bacterium]
MSGPQYVEYGGNTPCLEVAYDDTYFLIDAGTGIRPLGEQFRKNIGKEIQIFLSHPHLDHLIGLPFFAPAFQKETQIAIWLPAQMAKSGKTLLTQFLSSEVFPGGFEQIQALLRFYPAFEEIPIQMGEVSLHFCQIAHPGVTYGFKIITPKQKIGYITDHEFLRGYCGPWDSPPPHLLEREAKTIHFFSDLDLLIHEAQFSAEEYKTKIGWGHSSLPNTLAFLKATRTPQLLVTHHDPSHSDADLHALQQEANRMLEGTGFSARWIRDGEKIELPAPCHFCYVGKMRSS